MEPEMRTCDAVCPHCGSEEYKRGALEVVLTDVRCDCVCNACDTEFYEIWRHDGCKKGTPIEPIMKFTVRSETDASVKYSVVKMPNQLWKCECKAYLYSRTQGERVCKHIIKVRKALSGLNE